MWAIQCHFLPGQQLLAQQVGVLQSILLALVLVLGHAGIDDLRLQFVEGEIGWQVGKFAAKVFTISRTDLQPLQLLSYRVDQIV